MKPTTIFIWILALVCGFATATSWIVTMEAVAQRDYYKNKCLDTIVEKDAEIDTLTRELLKVEAVEDWLLLTRYVLPEIKRNEMLKEATITIHKLRNYMAENGELVY